MTALVPGADVYGVPAPAQLAADIRARGWLVVAGYAYDDDVYGSNPWTAAHAQAATETGALFVPIITLRNATTATVDQLAAALAALGYISGPVLWDREPTALPDLGLLSQLVLGLHGAGYSPHGGYRYPWTGLEPAYAALMDSLWAAIPGGPSNPPANAQHVQYGQWSNGHGTTYDLDTFDLDSLQGGFLMALTDAEQQDMYQKVTALFNQGAGTVNQILSLVNQIESQMGPVYNWDAGTGNSILAATAEIKAKLGITN